MWTNRKAVSLASSSPRRLHVSRFHHNIQVGSLPLIGQTSVLIASHCSGLKNTTTVEQMSPQTHGSFLMHAWCRTFTFKWGNNIQSSFYNCKLELLFFSDRVKWENSPIKLENKAVGCIQVDSREVIYCSCRWQFTVYGGLRRSLQPSWSFSSSSFTHPIYLHVCRLSP